MQIEPVIPQVTITNEKLAYNNILEKPSCSRMSSQIAERNRSFTIYFI